MAAVVPAKNVEESVGAALYLLACLAKLRRS
jgi:hypothetical protein